jgi:5-methylcytosine-specific restriction protein A
MHTVRECNPILAKKKKQDVLKKTGALKCEVCRFDYEEKYGAIGKNFAECHHNRPVSELIPGEKKFQIFQFYAQIVIE